jgi:DNA-binding LytR/AlgR family response regulator
MRVLIVDDEPAARRRLQLMLEELDVEVAGQAENGVRALELAASLRPDLLLLDIVMPEVDGFDVVRHLPEPRPLIVFQTAHDDFALEAFDHDAIDYVVKPVSLARLERALERARDRLGGPRAQIPAALIDRIRASVLQTASASGRRRILVREGANHRLLALGDIHRFEARAGAVFASTGDRDWLTDYTLTELEDRAGPAFIRPSRSVLLSIERVRGISTNRDGSAVLTLVDGDSERVSRRRAADVRAALER